MGLSLQQKPRLGASTYYLFRVVIVLCTLVVLVAAGLTVAWPEAGVTLQLSSGRVVAVTPEGPFDRAGIEPEDVVTAIDGWPLASRPLYEGSRAGDTVRISVRRGDEAITMPVTLAAPDLLERLWRLVPVVVAAAFWIAGLVLFGLRPRDQTCLAFFWVAQVAVVALAAGQLSTFNVVWAIHCFVWALAALPPLLVSAYGYLIAPDQPWLPALSRWMVGLSVLVGSIDVGFLLRFGRNAHMVSLWPRWRAGLLLYLGCGLLVLAGALVYAYAVTRRPGVRRRLRGLAFATSVGFLPMVLFSLLPEAIGGIGTGLPFPTTFPFLLLIPAAHLYVIIHYDLRALDRLINHSLVAFVLGSIWVATYLAMVGIGLRFIHTTPLFFPLVGMLATMAMALVFTPLREAIQRAVDRLFYGGWYDYRQIIAELSRDLSRVTSRQALGEQLVPPVVSGLHLRGAALYLQDAEEPGFALIASQGLELSSRVGDLEIWDGLGATGVVPSPKAWRERGVAWLLALRRPDAAMLGWLVLGEKREDDFFEEADVEILSTLREQATMAAENVLLFESLRETVRALEIAQQQLLTAREEERRILSWELHDGPLQDLIALSYDLYNCRIAIWQDMPNMGRRLEAARQEALRIKNVLRTACREMRSDLLDVLGLDAAIHRYVHDFMQENDVVIHLRLPSRRVDLPDPLGIALFRILQEALANAVAHGGTREVWVYLGLDDGVYRLNIWDEGHGFVVPRRLESLALRGHFGLITMRERAISVGADFEVTSKPGEGTHIYVQGDVPDNSPELGHLQP